MSYNLTRKQIDFLYQKLIVPIAISDIVTYDLEIEPDMQYNLHMTLSELDPDAALIAISLCSSMLIEKISKTAPITSILKNEAENLIEEYATRWIGHHNNAAISDEVLQNVMRHVPEDLESMADFLDVLCSEINNNNSNIVIIANILSIQARAHMEIADFILQEICYEEMITKEENGVEPTFYKPFVTETHQKDNIILFPMIRE